MTEEHNADLIGKALRVTSAALRPWIEQRIGGWPVDGHGRVEPRDPSYLIWVALNYREVRLARQLADNGNVLLADLRHTRNRWAHHIPFDDLDAVRALDTCRRVLLATGHESAAGSLETQIRSLIAATPSTAAVPRAEPDPERATRQQAGPGHRRMRSAEFREQQWADRFAPHVEPINRLVDDLIEEKPGSWMPYVPPHNGGIETKVLLLFQDPGKMTSTDHGGSGFLSYENDDPSAQTLAECMDDAKVDGRDLSTWNAYPWFLPDQGNLTVGMLNEGVDPLRRVVELMPELHTVVTCGKKAHDAWERFTRSAPTTAARYRHLKTFHTSGQGIINGGQQTKDVGMQDVTATLVTATTAPTR